VTSGETRSVLESLAVALTRTGVDGLSFSDRQIARSSRLVADGPDGSVLFSLPIFQHWFAAQAILAGDVPAAEVVADVLSFNRWRWAAAVAALSAPGAEAVEDLLGTWVAGNPGAAAWVINEAFSAHRVCMLRSCAVGSTGARPTAWNRWSGSSGRTSSCTSANSASPG
jgi:hypothetical protein